MNKILTLIIFLGLTALAGPIAAAENKDTDEKELCILYARDCADKVYNLQAKVKKIQEELAAGATVYKAEEIKRLKDKLKESEEMIDQLMPGTSAQKDAK